MDRQTNIYIFTLVERGDLEGIKKLHLERDTSPHAYMLYRMYSDAFKYNQWDIIKFLHSNGYIPKDAMDTAAFYNNLEIVKFLHSNGYVGCIDTLDKAIRRSNSEIVEFLLSNGYETIHNAIDIASFHNRLEVLKFLHARGYVGTSAALDWAIEHNYTEIAQFLTENAYTSNKNTDRSPIYAYCHGTSDHYNFRIKSSYHS